MAAEKKAGTVVAAECKVNASRVIRFVPRDGNVVARKVRVPELNVRR